MGDGPVLPRPKKQSGRMGVGYEKKVFKEIRKKEVMVRKGQWIAFEDENGPGMAQTDFLVQTEGGLVVLEAKLTFTHEAWDQLSFKYVPLLEAVEPPSVEIIPAQVCKSLTPEIDGTVVVEDFSEIRAWAVWHFLGR